MKTFNPPQGKRFNVIGTSGSGKSTFAKKLAKQLDYRYIEMDRVFWLPNWTMPADKDFFAKLSHQLEGEGWVLDGNYSRTIPIKWTAPITVVWIDLPFGLTVYQAIKRAVSRILSKKEIWPGTDNRETIRKSFFSKDSIILWTLKNYVKGKKKFQGYGRDPKFAQIHFVRLCSHKEADDYLRSVVELKAAATFS